MADTTLALGEDYPEVRAGVRKICEGFPGSYWRGLDERQEYPDLFVKALTEAGYLAALIPESNGGAGLPLELLDSLRLLGQARYEYLAAIVGYNQAQLRLYVTLGQPPAEMLARPVPQGPISLQQEEKKMRR